MADRGSQENVLFTHPRLANRLFMHVLDIDVLVLIAPADSSNNPVERVNAGECANVHCLTSM